MLANEKPGKGYKIWIYSLLQVPWVYVIKRGVSFLLCFKKTTEGSLKEPRMLSPNLRQIVKTDRSMMLVLPNQEGRTHIKVTPSCSCPVLKTVLRIV